MVQQTVVGGEVGVVDEALEGLFDGLVGELCQLAHQGTGARQVLAQRVPGASLLLLGRFWGVFLFNLCSLGGLFLLRLFGCFLRGFFGALLGILFCGLGFGGR